MGPDAARSAIAANIFDAELDAVESIASQMQSVQASLALDAQDARLSLTGTPLPQTALAGYLASMPNSKKWTQLPQHGCIRTT